MICFRGRQTSHTCFSDTGLPDEAWIIFGAPAQNLNGPPDFIVSSNDLLTSACHFESASSTYRDRLP